MNLPKVWHFGILDEISRYLGELPSDISNDTAEVYSLFENVTVFLAKSPILAEFFDSNFFRVAFLYNNVVENLLVEIRLVHLYIFWLFESNLCVCLYISCN